MKSVRWLVAAVAAALLALSGCTTPSASSAALVNGQPISVAMVEDPVQAIGGTSGEPGALADAHATVLSYAIRGQVARSIAAEQNIQLTGDPRTAVLSSNPNLAKYANDPNVGGFVTDVVDSTIVLNTIGQQAFLAKLAQTDVQVNPRFGSWSADSAAVSTSGGQLSQPWATPSTQP